MKYTRQVLDEMFRETAAQDGTLLYGVCDEENGVAYVSGPNIHIHGNTIYVYTKGEEMKRDGFLRDYTRACVVYASSGNYCASATYNGVSMTWAEWLSPAEIEERAAEVLLFNILAEMRSAVDAGFSADQWRSLAVRYL